MGLSVKSPPVQMQSLEEDCSKRRKHTEEDLSQSMVMDYTGSDFDEEEDALLSRKSMDKLFKTFQKNAEAIASCSKRKKPDCETNIDRPVATDMVPGDKPKKTRGKKKKNERVRRKGKMSCY